jgi:phosphatidylglycerol:prolipoprotein diacylglycerol transferase
MVAFSIFWINVYRYGIFYLIWFLITYFFLFFLWRSEILSEYPKLQNFLKKNLDDLMIALIIWVLVGWRLWEVFIYERDYFSQNPSEIVKVWHGGMSFFGWMIWVVLSLIFLFSIKKLSKKDVVLLFDCLVVILPIGITFWRFGNYLNQELYWLAVPEWARWLTDWIVSLLTNLNIFHVYSKIDSLMRVNTNFISIFFEWIVLFLLIFFVSKWQIKRKEIKIWLNSSIFLIFYSLFRFLIEYLRVDSQSQIIWKFTISQRLFLTLFIVGIGLLILLLNRKNKDKFS